VVGTEKLVNPKEGVVKELPMVLPPSLLLIYEPDELLLIFCDSDVVMPTSEDVVWAGLDREIAGVEYVTLGDDVESARVEVIPARRHEHAEEIFDGESMHLEA
jgi:hypothetical protein